MPQHFWVNQGDSFKEARRAGCLWAPERDVEGAILKHWETMKDLVPGDVVFTYSDTLLRGYAVIRSEAVNSLRPYQSDNPYQPAQGGRLAICEFIEFPVGAIGIKTILANPILKAELSSGDNPVLTNVETVAQKYLCPISPLAASLLRILAGLSPATGKVKKNKRLTRTETLALVNARVGQGQFREDLLKSFNDKCAVTELAVKELVRASHIRPWCKCESDEEKLDPQNGLLLAVGVDAAFDCGFITFNDDGSLKVSECLSAADLVRLGIPAKGSLHHKHLTTERRKYLSYHRENEFEKNSKRAKK